MAKRTPLFDRHVAAGARIVEFGGFDMPVWYSSLVDEHRCVRQAVGLFDVSHMGEIRVRGPGALAALEWLVSNTVTDMARGQARYALLCNDRGGVVDDLIVYRVSDDDFLVCVNASNREKDFAWFTANNPRTDATITDEGDLWGQIAIQGPASELVLASLTPSDLGTIAYYHHAPGTVAGIPGCIIARTGYTGSPGFEVFVPADQASALWDALMKAGEPHGIKPIGLGARDTLRMEARMPLYGHELSDDISPTMAKLTRVCKFEKPGSFLGAAAILARKEAGTDTKVLAGALIDGKRVVRDGTRVLKDGVDVGWVTSGTRSPILEKGICMLYVEAGLDAPGTVLQFDLRGSLETGTVVSGAFVKKSAA